jgi:hypothetical protein
MELNNNLIEMPIASVEIEKKTAIHFRIKANLKDEFKNQSILLIFAADVLMPDSVKSDEFKIEILNEINTGTKAEKYDLSENFLISLIGKNEEIFYKRKEKEKEFIIRPNSLSLKFNILEYSFVENHFLIKGKFSARITNSNGRNEDSAHIEKGKFEIII